MARGARVILIICSKLGLWQKTFVIAQQQYIIRPKEFNSFPNKLLDFSMDIANSVLFLKTYWSVFVLFHFHFSKD